MSIWQLSANLLLTSSPLKLCQVGWGQKHIFRFLQKYLIGFKLMLWLGHSRTFTELSISHSCCVLGPFSCWKVNLLPSQVLMLWTVFSLRLSQYFWFIEFFFYSDESLSPCRWKTAPQHEAATKHTLLLGWYLCMWWAELVSFKHDAWNWGSSDQRILFLTVWGSFRCFFANSKCVFMCLHWREDWVLPHHHKAQIGGVLQWCLSFCRFLLFPHMIMELN